MDEETGKIANRLKSIEGHVRGVSKIVAFVTIKERINHANQNC
jgi:DNA-binding FrmR family transcriptional regulator